MHRKSKLYNNNDLVIFKNALVDKYGNGTYEEKSNITDKINNTLDSVQGNLLWDTSDAWNTGVNVGKNIKGSVNDWASQFQNGKSTDGGTSKLDGIGNKLGLDFSQFDGTGAGGLNTNDYGDVLDNIAGDTGSIADSMDLTAEDLRH